MQIQRYVSCSHPLLQGRDSLRHDEEIRRGGLCPFLEKHGCQQLLRHLRNDRRCARFGVTWRIRSLELAVRIPRAGRVEMRSKAEVAADENRPPFGRIGIDLLCNVVAWRWPPRLARVATTGLAVSASSFIWAAVWFWQPGTSI